MQTGDQGQLQGAGLASYFGSKYSLAYVKLIFSNILFVDSPRALRARGSSKSSQGSTLRTSVRHAIVLRMYCDSLATHTRGVCGYRFVVGPWGFFPRDRTAFHFRCAHHPARRRTRTLNWVS